VDAHRTPRREKSLGRRALRAVACHFEHHLAWVVEH
jgi:hypothetical protein